MLRENLQVIFNIVIARAIYLVIYRCCFSRKVVIFVTSSHSHAPRKGPHKVICTLLRSASPSSAACLQTHTYALMAHRLAGDASLALCCLLAQFNNPALIAWLGQILVTSCGTEPINSFIYRDCRTILEYKH